MSNPLEGFWNTLKGLAQVEPSTPLHVGEVMGMWTYYTALKEMLRFEEIGLNMTRDPEVKEMLSDAYSMCKDQAKRTETFLITEGVPLPSTSPPKPHSSPNDLPEGVRITDDEIVNAVSLKAAVEILECANGQAISIRSDVGLFWTELQSEMLTFSTTLKQLMKKRGWLKVPPYFNSPAEIK